MFDFLGNQDKKMLLSVNVLKYTLTREQIVTLSSEFFGEELVESKSGMGNQNIVDISFEREGNEIHMFGLLS